MKPAFRRVALPAFQPAMSTQEPIPGDPMGIIRNPPVFERVTRPAVAIGPLFIRVRCGMAMPAIRLHLFLNARGMAALAGNLRVFAQ